MLDTKLGDLKYAASMIWGAQMATTIAEETWAKSARPCKYNQDGGDGGGGPGAGGGLECTYMGENSSDDPSCYADNCPLLNDLEYSEVLT
jgi:hypothetical protein